MELIKEFKPALFFLGKFLAIYFIGNILYGIYIESYDLEADPITRIVTVQSSALLNLGDYEADYRNVPGQRKVALLEKGEVVLNVFEGCNGVNVIIVFIAFVFAYGGPPKWLVAFSLGGLLTIHIFNLLRVQLLFKLAFDDSKHFYYYHKFFFTASLYLVVFVLWAYWVYRFHEKESHKTAR